MITLKLSARPSSSRRTIEKRATLVSRTPIASATTPSRPGKAAPASIPRPGHEPDHAVALLQAVAADQLEDHHHEGDRDRRREDPRLRGEVDLRALRRRSGERAHRSASACRGRNWPTSSTIIPLKMKKAERSGVRKELPPARSSIRTGTSSTRSPCAHRELQRLDLGEVGRVVLAEQRHHPPVRRPHAARRVGEALPRRQGEEEAEDAGPDPPRERRLVVVASSGLAPPPPAAVAVARADHQVGAVGVDLLQQPRHLGRRVLAVGVEVRAEVVALAQRVEVAGLQRRPEALVEGQRGDQRAGLARPRRGRVGRAVVDDEHVGPGQALAHVGDHLRDRGLLVPGRDEDQRPHPRRFSHAGRRPPRPEPRHCVLC